MRGDIRPEIQKDIGNIPDDVFRSIRTSVVLWYDVVAILKNVHHLEIEIGYGLFVIK